VFWRAVVHPWRVFGREYEPISVGPYEQELRKFLLGLAPFPVRAALTIWIADSPKPMMFFDFPTTSVRLEGSQFAKLHRFSIPSLTFNLVLGGGVSQEHKDLCIYLS
jgi:hypothetical protein